MAKILPIIIIGLLTTFGCLDRKEPVITIVNIGHCNRVELGKQIGIINKYSPKIIALDFFLVPDSLDKDIILVNELQAIRNTVQIVGLHDLYEPDYIWDSLEVSHPKFQIESHSFANLTSEDSVLIKELPIEQTFDSKQIHCFSYVIAENSFGVKDKFKGTQNRELKLNMNGLGKNYRLITAEDLLNDNFEKQDLKNKIVIMGCIGENDDLFYLDKEKTKKINGVEVHAAIVDELINL